MLANAAKSLTRGPILTTCTLISALLGGTWWLVGDGVAPGDPSTPEERLVVAVSENTEMTPPVPGEQQPPAAESKRKRRKLSEGERVARLQRSIETDRTELNSLRTETESPGGEFRAAEAEFKALDDRWREIRRKYYTLRREGKQQEADAWLAENKPLEQEWQTAKDRFDLAIQERKTLRDKAAALERKIQQDAAALQDLVGFDPSAVPAPPGGQAPPATTVPAEAPLAGQAPADKAPVATQPQSPQRSRDDDRPPLIAAPDEHPAPTTPNFETAPQLPTTPSLPMLSPLARAATDPYAGPAPMDAAAPGGHTYPTNPAFEHAKKEVDERLAAAQQAERVAESVGERIAALRSNMAIEQQLLDIAHAKATQAQSLRASLDTELERTVAQDPAQLDTVWKKIAQVDERQSHAQTEATAIQRRIEELQREVGRLEEDQAAARSKAKQLHEQADAAQGLLNNLQNPFTPTNLVQWSLDHGPKLLTILIGTLMLSLVVKLSGRQIAQIVARGGSRGTAKDRENRAITLVGVFRNTASIVLCTGGMLMALDEVGIPIGPLMGGAAVLGLAVAFGAQNLIRDYFSGFMVLLEDQYGINDVVKIGDVAGSVEKITLRMTVLRDLEGAVHFIPHGSITRVSNMTHGWSRAVIDIGVAYKENPDEVMRVLVDIAKDLRKDPTYGPLILDGPEMLGLDNLGDSAVMFKMFLKTQPLQRWFVKREWLRRIKNRFDELGIEIPFPQRTVHHRYDDGDPRGADAQHSDSSKRAA
ncbi:MAG: mechanosensitive ion channel domain-containing protein [Pirellulales bacterium]